MLKKKLFRIWRFVFPFLFIFFLVHFLKDITQDILRVPTFLDVFGDVKEDLSSFPKIFQQFFLILDISSVFGEIFLLIAIPIVLKRKQFSKLELGVLLVTVFILLFILSATLLDPRYGFWLKKKKSASIVYPTSNKLKKIIISTDNAATAKILRFFAAEPDDSLALAVLLEAHKDKELEILGIASTFGNKDGETTYQITKRQVELSGLDIPVIKGATYQGQIDSQAVEFITNKLRESNGKIVFLGFGPATDFTAVFKKYPELKEKVEYFLLVRSGPYLIKKYWYLFSFNALKDIKSAKFMYQLEANQFLMGDEIFKMGIDNETIERLQKIENSMMRYITKDLPQWNLQNKFFPNKGYFARKGNMCPWDLVWAMYLVEPDLYTILKKNNHYSIHIKNKELFLQKTMERLTKWGN